MLKSIQTGLLQTEAQEKSRDQSRREQQCPEPRIIRELCEELNSRGVIYCHWKSNAMLERSVLGENDLDLLVSRADSRAFIEILYRLGFRQAEEPSRTKMPGVQDYYGYDKWSDRLIHVHAHYQLVLGHDATKNYHLPIERAYLKSAVKEYLFKIPLPEFELIVFIIRMVLKHSTWDVILARQGTLSSTESEELRYLQSRISPGRMLDIVNEHLPFLGTKKFNACMRSLQPNCPLLIRIRAAHNLQKGLRAHARHLGFLDIWLKLWRRLATAVQRRVTGNVPRKRMASGGLMVAIVGGDGAGKTTAVDELYTWLSEDFETIKIHMGKPTWSRATITIRGILKIGRSLGLYPFMRADIQYTKDSKKLVFPGYPWLLREICTARDRYLAFVKGRRFATNGGLVICDRYPLPQIEYMDGPQSDRMTRNVPGNAIIRFLGRLEKRYYRSLTWPELLIILKVDPEIAVQRKEDEDAESVRPRSQEIWELDWSQTPAHVIDAGRSKVQVMRELKTLIWSQM